MTPAPTSPQSPSLRRLSSATANYRRPALTQPGGELSFSEEDTQKRPPETSGQTERGMRTCPPEGRLEQGPYAGAASPGAHSSSNGRGGRPTRRRFQGFSPFLLCFTAALPVYAGRGRLLED